MAPDRLPATRPFRVVELALLEGALAGLSAAGDAASDPDAAAAAVGEALAQLPSLGELYVSMLEHGAAAFAELARLVGAARATARTRRVPCSCTAPPARTAPGSPSLSCWMPLGPTARRSSRTWDASSEANLSVPRGKERFASDKA